MAPIYTKTGDNGTTATADGRRMDKSCALLQGVGEVDELNSHIGFFIALLDAESARPRYVGVSSTQRVSTFDFVKQRLQAILFDVGAAVAGARAAMGDDHASLLMDEVAAMEAAIDRMTEALPPLRAFVMPGGSNPATAYLHVVRTACRRAERALVLANTSGGGVVSPAVLTFMNRLSDYVFTLARFASFTDGWTETKYVNWQKRDAGRLDLTHGGSA